MSTVILKDSHDIKKDAIWGVAEESLRIFSVVLSFANVFRTDPPWVRPSEGEADNNDDEEGAKDWETEEGDMKEDNKDLDGPEVCDT